MSSFLTVSRRVSAMISASAISTTLRVLLNGALNTAMPRAAAASRSIWLVPMQKAPMASSRFAPSSASSVTWVPDRMPISSASEMRPGQLVGGGGPVPDLDLPPGLGQQLGCNGVDVLEEDGAHDPSTYVQVTSASPIRMWSPSQGRAAV